ncbi:Leucine Rich Repeat [Fragilaria crotonensis]|nr:Leucine Rich Repeat [Fragilaria crotonensis]
MNQTQSQQGEILRALVQGEEGRQWAARRNRGWVVGSDSDVCSWDGVQCDTADQVTALALPETDLLATLPTELAILTQLEIIDLRQNLLQGTIPIEFASMTSLVSVVLKDNLRLTGSIPVFKSSKLKHLDLSRMGLTGQIPPDFGKRNLALTLLELKGNQLSFLPFGLEDLPLLETISVSSNKLSGTLPAYIGNMASLSYLYLNSNFIVGTIPNLSRPLQEVWLQNNLLSGTIPSSIEVSVLQDLFLDGNKLTGSVPQALCEVDLNADFFSDVNDDDRNLCDSVTCPAGTVSDQGVYPCRNCTSEILNPYLGIRGECDDWTEARIVNVLLKGKLKSACEYTDIVTCNSKGKVTKIQASGRKLTGTLPDELGLLESLEVLDVSDNDLNGFFPSGLRFAPLTSLNFGGNKLKGILPPLVCKKANQINNGTGDCTSIACPIGTYSNGKGFGECLPCADGAPYLASTSCFPPVNLTNPPAQSGITSGLFWGLIFLIPLMGLALSALMYFKYKDRRTKTANWERGVTLDDKRASFPHVEEVKTMLQGFRSRANKSSSKNHDWLQNRLRRSYNYVISLKETEAVKDPPGTKTMDVTGGEIDDFGWQERDSILLHRDLENLEEAQQHRTKLEVWEYPDPLEKPLTYTKSFDDQSDDDDYLSDDDDLLSGLRSNRVIQARGKCGLIYPR